MTRHEHHARYDFARDALWCPGCGRVLLTAEWLENRGIVVEAVIWSA